MKIVADAKAPFEFGRTRQANDWSPVLEALSKAKPGVPLVIEGIVPPETPEKEIRKVLSAAKASLERFLGSKNAEMENGTHAIDYVELGYSGNNLAVRLKG